MELTLRDKDKNNKFAYQCLFMSEITSETLREVFPYETGNYTILSVLKEGRRARVFLAEKAGKRFVLKAPASEGGRDLALLRREWEIAVGLSHPGLVYSFTWEASSPVGPCLVQEWVDGRTLADYLNEKRSLEARKRTFAQLLSVVAYLHKKGVLHNDLSPANILITRADNAVKLIDLGFADNDMHISEKGVGGTPGFASPELCSGLQTDARSDIWTLGALMRQLFPHRYGRISSKCQRTSPQQRYGSVEALEKAWRNYWRPLRVVLSAIALITIGILIWSYIDSRREMDSVIRENAGNIEALSSARAELDSLKRIETERAEALAAAKAEVDAWYAREIPAFRKALKRARLKNEAQSAYMALIEKMKEVNFDIPARTPEIVRPNLRDYIIDRYNKVFSDISLELAARMDELPVN